MTMSGRNVRTFAAVVATSAVIAVLLSGCPASSHSSDSCGAPGMCPATGRATDRSGFTNNTGWQPDGHSCCDICDVPGTKTVNCFNPATCGRKTGDNDWDFLILDQIWLEQLCAAFDQGHDPTLTHMPGVTCRSDARRTTGLSIHGLWPNYVGGYPQCCSQTTLPVDLPSALLEQARAEWVDPTTADGDKCGFCSMWAHEAMKHGTCFSKDTENYFHSTLNLLSRMKDKTLKVNGLLQSASVYPVKASDLAAIYAPFQVQLVCDARDRYVSKSSDSGVFLELRTCWNRTAGFSYDTPDVNELYQISCPGRVVGNEPRVHHCKRL